jgi:hypothetical protein
MTNNNNNLNKSEIEKYKSKIIYTNQGWGIADNNKLSKNFNSKVFKINDKSSVHTSKDLKASKNTIVKNLKKQINELKISGNQKIVKLGVKSSKPLMKSKNNKLISSHQGKNIFNSDDEFFEDFD